MVWSKGGVSEFLPFLGIDPNRRKPIPDRITPGSMFPLAQVNLPAPDTDQRNQNRMVNAYERLGVVDNISKDAYATPAADNYLDRAENLMFRANQVNQQAAMLRLRNATQVHMVGPRGRITGTLKGGGRAGHGAGPLPKGGLGAFIRAISGKESGGNYHARNPSSGAMGKYQIMPANIAGPGGWDKEALGRNISVQQFMNSPRLQEQIARHKLTQYYRHFGPAGAASAWYSGSPTKWKTGAGHGSQGAYPSIYNYVQAILRAMGR